MSEMTGVNPEFLENEEFAAKILPTLRGFQAIAKYDCPPDATVSCPIFAFLGDDDEVATYEKALVGAHDIGVRRAGFPRSSLLSQRPHTRAGQPHRGQDLVVLPRLT